MRIDILTVFPEMFAGPMDTSILGRAKDKGILDIRLHNIRDYSEPSTRTPMTTHSAAAQAWL